MLYVALVPAAEGSQTRGTIITNAAVNATYKQKFEHWGKSIRARSAMTLRCRKSSMVVEFASAGI
jgi:hypothetical protein